MKQLCMLFWLLTTSALAQDGEQFLQSSASMLARNRAPQTTFFFATIREKKRLDTLSASGQNYRFRAFNYLWQGNYEQAVEWMEKTTTLYPNQHGIVGEVYMTSLRDYPRALTHFNAYDALTPNFDDIIGFNPVSYMRGLAYRKLGDYEKSIHQFSIAIDSLEHKHGAEWVNYRHFISRAVSYIATQQPEKALVDLDKSLRNFKRSALAQYHRGRALLQLNRIDEAQAAFQDAAFFFKALRAERTGYAEEDSFNPVSEAEIDDALDTLKSKNR
jgi:tetratricopeptide (TPR) repeat protein